MRNLPTRKANRIRIRSSHRQWTLKRSHSTKKGDRHPGGKEQGQIGPHRDSKKSH